MHIAPSALGSCTKGSSWQKHSAKEIHVMAPPPVCMNTNINPVSPQLARARIAEL